MKLSLGRVSFLYQSCLLLIFVSAIAWSIYYLENYGPVNVENVGTLYQAANKIDELSKNDDLETIRSLVLSDQSREALRSLDRLEKNIRVVDQSLADKNKKHLFDEELKNFRQQLNQLVNSPEFSTVINVLQNKILDFQNFVELNKWRTLSRISSRLSQKMIGMKTKKQGFFSAARIREFQQSLNTDISTMISVTEASVLPVTDKTNILEHIKGLKTEVELIDNYLQSLVRFEEVYGQTTKKYKEWTKMMAPELYLEKIKYEKSTKTISVAPLIFLAAIFFMGFLGIIVRNLSYKRDKKEVENLIYDVIKDGLLSAPHRKGVLAENDHHEFNEKFVEEFGKLKEYIHRRMNFGSIFQESLPFAAIMLDANLKLVWANPLFCEQWNLENSPSKLDHITWDYLLKFTNLGENDPVPMAATNQLAGIYQIQVRLEKKGEMLPYEMYVSPVEQNGVVRTMIFFYPLRSLVDTLANQSRALVGPITRTLDVLAHEQFNADFQEKVYKDYEVAGIEEIYEKFCLYHDYVSTQKNGLMAEMASLENALYDQYKVADDSLNKLSIGLETFQEVTKKFEELKSNLISTIDGRNDTTQTFHSSVSAFKTLVRDFSDLNKVCHVQLELIRENQKALTHLSQLKDGLKNYKSAVEDSRMQLNLSIDQVLIFTKSADLNPSKLEPALNKIKFDLKALEKCIVSMTDNVSSFDIGLSKLQLIMEKNEIPDLNRLDENLQSSKAHIEKDIFKIGKIEKSSSVDDERIILSMKNMFQNLGELKKRISDVEDMLKTSNPKRTTLHDSMEGVHDVQV